MFTLATASVAQIEAEIVRLRALGAGTMHLRMELARRGAAPFVPVAAVVQSPAAIRKDCRRMARELARR